MEMVNNKVSGLEKEIDELIKKIYKNKSYPSESDFLINEEKAKEIYESLKRVVYETNSEFKICPDCNYCYYILVSESIKVPPMPDFKKGTNDRKIWVKKYGRYYYQMYIVISKLGRYALIYWSKYTPFLFGESQRIVYKCPSWKWKDLYDKIVSELQKMDIKLVPEKVLNKTKEIQYKGPTYFDTSPTVLKLLFTEEVH
jgi:hypothetical protein